SATREARRPAARSSASPPVHRDTAWPPPHVEPAVRCRLASSLTAPCAESRRGDAQGPLKGSGRRPGAVSAPGRLAPGVLVDLGAWRRATMQSQRYACSVVLGAVLLGLASS